MGDEWGAWRVVSRGLAPSVDYIDRHWSLDRVLDANEYLDACDDAEALVAYARRLASEGGASDGLAALRDPRIAATPAAAAADAAGLDERDVADLRSSMAMAAEGDDDLAARLEELLGLPPDEDDGIG